MGRYQAYPEYKDSGLEWLGHIPNHWSRLKFKFTSKEGKAFASGPFGSSIGSQFYRDSGVPVIRGNNLSLNGNKPKFVDDGYVFLDETKADELSNAEVIAGDLVFTARGTVGQVGLVPSGEDFTWGRAILSANQLRFRNHDTGFSSNYLWYLFSSWLIRTQVLLSSDSVAQPNLNLGSLKDLHLLRPSFEEQVSIANFLDHETAKIDTLIEKQQQLIQLLKEKRQAVISHAVTKGLSANAPMKDSGVEWLGDVPEHWGVISLHRIVQANRPITYGIVQPGEPDENGRYMIRNQDFSSGWVSGESIFRVSEKVEAPYKRARMQPNDLVMTIVGAVGNVGIIPDWLDGANTTQNLSRIAIDTNKAEPLYIANVLQGPIGKRNVDRYSKGGVQAALNLDHIKRFILPVPPLDEQREMIKVLQNEISKFDSIERKAEDMVDLLKERRTALISATVTGKIDVRDWQAPQN